MTKFKFKLETVLKVKLRIEEMRKLELHAAELRREAARAELEARRNEVADAMQSFRDEYQTLDLYMRDQYHRFIKWLTKQAELAAAKLRQAEAEVAERRQALVVATQEKKVIEKLKEKAYRAFMAQELQADIKFLDELGTGRFVRESPDRQEGV